MPKKILISPLDWGLGHASRIIPIIRLLQNKENKIIVATNKNTENYLKQYFCDLKFIDIPSYKIKYSQKHLILDLILQIPKIIRTIKNEHKWLKKIIETEKIDCVISDNRYGLWNKKIKTVFITHQINIKLPKKLKIFEKLLYKQNKKLIEKFDYCLIPDEPDSKFTGELTNKYALPDNAIFIGLLSRFSGVEYHESNIKTKFDVFVILSGAEPQKTEFLELIINKFKDSKYKILIASGNINSYNKKIKNIKILPHLTDNDFFFVTQNTPNIISRAGYSTIMDLVSLGKTAILIPTPGQTEQEYLSKINNNKFEFISQNKFKSKFLLKTNNLKINKYTNNMLEKIIFDVLNC